MAGKRYYWLKLQEDFFRSKRIKKLRKMAGGDTYTIIYLKMQLLAMKNDGILVFSGLEHSFSEELALDLDEEPDDVEVTVRYLLACGLMETSDKREFFIPYAVQNVGSETSAAQRMRESRAKRAIEGCNNVTPALQPCYVEKERDKEIEKDRSSTPARTREEENLGKVMSFIMDRLNPMPSPLMISDVKHYIEKLEPDVIIHAVSLGLDEKKTSWSYIKAILQRYVREGKTTMLAVRDEEAQRQQDRSSRRGGKQAIPDYNTEEDETL